jgi:AbrB family looped-hinge helix DNA binding protein
MITTIDKAGRIVIPKRDREELGLIGNIELIREEGSLRIAPIKVAPVRNVAGKLRLPLTGHPITTDDVRRIRNDEQR